MTNIKISPKGKALLKRAYSSSSSIVRAIVEGGDKLTSDEGLTVVVDGKSLKLKIAPASTEPVTSR